MSKLSEKFGDQFAEDISVLGQKKRSGNHNEDLVRLKDMQDINSTTVSLDMQTAREAHRAAAFDRSRHNEHYSIGRESTNLDHDGNLTKEDLSKVSGRKYAYHKNNSVISQVLDIDPKAIRPIENDW